MQNKISIIGSSGYLGKNLYNFLSKKKTEHILGVDSKNGNLLTKKIIKISKNFNNSKVIYLAAKHRKYGDNLNLKKQNIKMLKNFLLSIKENKPNFVIFVSTVEIYGKVKLKVNEKTRCKPLNKYAEGKIIQEKLILKFCNKNNIKCMIIRIPGIYGKNDKNSIIYKIYKTIRDNKTVWHSSGNEKRNYLHVDDFCRIVQIIFNRKRLPFNIINIISDKSVKLKFIFDMFMNSMKINRKIKFLKHKNEFDLVFDNKNLKKIVGAFKFKKLENEIKKYKI